MRVFADWMRTVTPSLRSVFISTDDRLDLVNSIWECALARPGSRSLVSHNNRPAAAGPAKILGKAR